MQIFSGDPRKNLHVKAPNVQREALILPPPPHTVPPSKYDATQGQTGPKSHPSCPAMSLNYQGGWQLCQTKKNPREVFYWLISFTLLSNESAEGSCCNGLILDSSCLTRRCNLPNYASPRLGKHNDPLKHGAVI